MKLEIINKSFAICKLKNASDIKPDGSFMFAAITNDEVSLVCEEDKIPANAISCEYGYMALRFCGALDFSLTGILAGLSGVLAEKGIPIFAVSTYDTDYILIKKAFSRQAAEALRKAGYTI